MYLWLIVAFSVVGVLVARHPVSEAVYWFIWALLFARTGWVFWHKGGLRLPAFADGWIAAIGFALSLSAASGRTFDDALGDRPWAFLLLIAVPLLLLWGHRRWQRDLADAWQEAARKASIREFLLASYVPERKGNRPA